MRIALLQASPCHDLDDGYQRLDQALADARAAGATVLVTPEMWLGGYNIAPQTTCRNSEQFDQMAQTVGQIVARYRVAIVIGCAAPFAPKPQNMAVAFDEQGQIVARYAKCHLFGGIDQDRFAPGPAVSPVFELAGARVGLAICYDIEFPETARSLALNGAELILVPTANMAPYETVNRRLVPARAEENGVFVAYVNLCGAEGTVAYCGLSCLCDPNGNTLALGGDAPQLLFADIDLNDVHTTQNQRPFLKDRRDEIYFEKD